MLKTPEKLAVAVVAANAITVADPVFVSVGKILSIIINDPLFSTTFVSSFIGGLSTWNTSAVAIAINTTVAVAGNTLRICCCCHSC